MYAILNAGLFTTESSFAYKKMYVWCINACTVHWHVTGVFLHSLGTIFVCGLSSLYICSSAGILRVAPYCYRVLLCRIFLSSGHMSCEFQFSCGHVCSLDLISPQKWLPHCLPLACLPVPLRNGWWWGSQWLFTEWRMKGWALAVSVYPLTW